MTPATTTMVTAAPVPSTAGLGPLVGTSSQETRSAFFRPRDRSFTYESPQGRRVNALTVLAAPGTHTHAPLTGWTASHPWKGRTASISCARSCPAARRGPGGTGIWLWYLPACNPELNGIEQTFRTGSSTAPCPGA